MQTSNSVQILKALADRSRLSVVKALLERPQYVELLAERLELAPSTVSFHMKKLEEAGLVYRVREQYYTIFHPRREVFDLTLGELAGARDPASAGQAARVEAYRQKVLSTWCKDGRIERLPAQHKKRWIVLEEIASRFQTGRDYPEAEVNAIIEAVHADYCTVRRELIGAKVMTRKDSIYRLDPGWRRSSSLEGAEPMDHERGLKQSFWESIRDTAPETPDAGRTRNPRRAARKALKQAYLQDKRLRPGVLRVRIGDVVSVSSSRDVDSLLNRVQTQLSTGGHRDKALQDAWRRFGESAAKLEVVERIPPPEEDDEAALDAILKQREAYWRAQSEHTDLKPTESAE